MRELDVLSPESLNVSEKARLMLLVCDERNISCVNLREFKEMITEVGIDAILVMPDYQYQKGTRGWAKAQILASVTERLKGVMPLDYESANQEVGNNWALVKIEGQVRWSKPERAIAEEIDTGVPINESTDPFDVEMIAKARRAAESSNCWLDPAGCVFVRGDGVLLESASTSFNNSNCREIPLDFRELHLNPGERMLFCDSLHAERVGISHASKDGISLEGSTIYATKFPCRPCAMEIIGAGIKTVIFERDSYGLSEAVPLLVENGVELKRVSSTKQRES